MSDPQKPDLLDEALGPVDAAPEPKQEIALADDRPESVLALISRIATNPDVNVEKMQALIGMQERIMDRNAKAAFVRAFADLQAELPRIDKKGAIRNNNDIIQSRYAKWEDLHRAIAEPLARHGFSLTFKLGSDDGKPPILVSAHITHVDGHSEETGFMPLPVDASGAKNNVQGIGSSMSYGKRYTTIALLNIVTEDDTDGRTVRETDALTDAQLAKVAEAEIEAGKGLAAYQAWFKAAPRQDKVWLTSSSGQHERLKKIAAGEAPGGEPSKSSPGPGGVQTNLDDIEKGKIK